MSEPTPDDVQALRDEVAQLRAAQETTPKRGIGKGLAWTLVIVLLLVITFVLITIYDHVSGNFDDRNSPYGAPETVSALLTR